MNFFETEFVQFLWRVFCLLVLVGMLISLIKSAVASWKRTGKITSVFDEVALGILCIVIFFILVNNPLSTIVNWCVTPIKFILNSILKMFTQITGIPL